MIKRPAGASMASGFHPHQERAHDSLSGKGIDGSGPRHGCQYSTGHIASFGHAKAVQLACRTGTPDDAADHERHDGDPMRKQQPSKSIPSRRDAKPEVETDAQRQLTFAIDTKKKIIEARNRAALSVNRELVLLYWNIGQELLTRQGREGWGARLIEQLATDLKRAFPEMKGVSARNLQYMRAFAEAWPDVELVQQVAAQLPWGHHMRLLDIGGASDEREWYARQAIEHGWSLNVLAHQIDSGLFARQRKPPG
jgi:predicted nuclease of restriction endonuclease-like (RecB) superfamily